MSAPKVKPSTVDAHDPLTEFGPSQRFDAARAVLEIIEITASKHPGELRDEAVSDALIFVGALLESVAPLVPRHWPEVKR